MTVSLISRQELIYFKINQIFRIKQIPDEMKEIITTENAIFVGILTSLKVFVYEVPNKIRLSYIFTHFTFSIQTHIRSQIGLQFYT